MRCQILSCRSRGRYLRRGYRLCFVHYVMAAEGRWRWLQYLDVS
jgi:hypothetical protein